MNNLSTQKLSLQRKIVVKLNSQFVANQGKNQRNNRSEEQNAAIGQHKFAADSGDTTIFDSFFCEP